MSKENSGQATTFFDSSLAHCQAFAKQFSNTCTDNAAVANLIFLTPKTIKCENTGPNCVDSGTRAQDSVKCEFNRKLCVSCSQLDSNSPVKIRVQGNGLPPTCFWAFSELKEQTIDIEMNWNPPLDLDTSGKVIQKVS